MLKNGIESKFLPRIWANKFTEKAEYVYYCSHFVEYETWNVADHFFFQISNIFLLSCLVKSGRSPPITGSRQTTNQPSLPADTSSQLSVLSARNSVENLSIQLDVHFQQAGNLIMFFDWYFCYLAFYCYDTMNIDPEARPGIFLSLKYYDF